MALRILWNETIKLNNRVLSKSKWNCHNLIRKFSSKIEQDRIKYKNNTLVLYRWLSLEFIKTNGRVHAVDEQLMIPSDDTSIEFPNLEVTTLTGNTIHVPNSIPSARNIKMICFSFNQVGATYAKTWIDGFNQLDINRDLNKSINLVEIHFIEYSLLSYFKSSFIENIKKSTDSDRWECTALTFGGVKVCFLNNQLYFLHSLYCRYRNLQNFSCCQINLLGIAF